MIVSSTWAKPPNHIEPALPQTPARPLTHGDAPEMSVATGHLEEDLGTLYPLWRSICALFVGWDERFLEAELDLAEHGGTVDCGGLRWECESECESEESRWTMGQRQKFQ